MSVLLLVRWVSPVAACAAVCGFRARTYEDDHPTGTKIYAPRVEKYFIVEDDCAVCDQGWSDQGPDGNPYMEAVDLKPPSSETVSSAPLFSTRTDGCYGGAQAGIGVGTYENDSTKTV